MPLDDQATTMERDWEQLRAQMELEQKTFKHISRLAWRVTDDELESSLARDPNVTTVPLEGDRESILDAREVDWLTCMWVHELVKKMGEKANIYIYNPGVWSAVTSQCFRLDGHVKFKTIFDREMTAMPVFLERERHWMAAVIVNPTYFIVCLPPSELAVTQLPVILFAHSDPNITLDEKKMNRLQDWLTNLAQRKFPGERTYTEARLARLTVPHQQNTGDCAFHMMHNFRQIHQHAKEILRRLKWNTRGDMLVMDDLTDEEIQRIWEPEKMACEKASFQRQLGMYWNAVIHDSAGANVHRFREGNTRRANVRVRDRPGELTKRMTRVVEKQYSPPECVDNTLRRYKPHETSPQLGHPSGNAGQQPLSWVGNIYTVNTS
ncbi:hypothetical protein BD410DRAFT_810667, partial [Rickenella mellea]